MEQLRAAFATDDGHTFTDGHFGDAKKYIIYSIQDGIAQRIGEIDNTTGPEQDHDHDHHHGDQKKAQGIGQLMKQNGIQVLVGKAFGPNIKRMNPKFVIVLMNDETIEQAAIRLSQHFDLLLERWNQGESRTHINLKK